MRKMVTVGNDRFDSFITEDGYYVDKTEFVYELLTTTRNMVTLFTRPRRFGKTLMMSMMESFFDIRRDSRDVFHNLSIMKKHPDFCEEWMNRYPTLFLSLKDVEGRTFEQAYAQLQKAISDLCKMHDNLGSEPAVNQHDSRVFHQLEDMTANEVEVTNSLKTIMRMMNAVYGKPVILLIDEYDVPLAKAQEKGYYSTMMDIIRGLMSISLKTNDYLKFAVLTGCLRISKESIFTGVNNFKCYSVMENRFSQYFGFTANEVEDMLKYFQLSEKFGIIREWYDGYVFGKTEVFCPWDVVQYIDQVLDDGGNNPKPFWVNSSGNMILESFVNSKELNPAEEFEALLNGGTITRTITEELTYNELYASKENIWSVLLMTGYVTKADAKEMGDTVRLRIPNKEIAESFQKAVIDRFKRRLDVSKVDAFITALWNEDEKTASETLSDILWNSISFNDYGENYYHGMLNGIFTSRGYELTSNTEEGLGRLDLRIKDQPNRRCILFEFKVNANLEEGCNAAIEQISRNGYDRTKPEGYTQQIVYGLSFHKKTARVKLKK